MVRHWNYLPLVVFLTATQGTAAAERPAAQGQDYGPAVRRAVAMLPERPAQVFVLDVNQTTLEDRDHLLRLQAFIIRGRPVIYLTSHGEALRKAVKGSPFHEHILATIIWHEMAHVAGAGEREARRREEALWTRFMLDHAVDLVPALHYLSALKKRPTTGIE